MKLCEYANNLTKILTICSVIVYQKKIKVSPTSEYTFQQIDLYFIGIYSSNPAGMGLKYYITIDEYIKAKPERSKYKYINIYTYLRELLLEMKVTDELSINNVAIYLVGR